MIFQNNSFIVIFSFWRQLYIFYQPSLDKYISCLCRTITGIFSTRKIARTCFCCPISLITRWKHRFFFWGVGRAYIYIHINLFFFQCKYFFPVSSSFTMAQFLHVFASVAVEIWSPLSQHGASLSRFARGAFRPCSLQFQEFRYSGTSLRFCKHQ